MSASASESIEAPDANVPSHVPRPARVFACSDIHTDFPENLEWVRSLSDVDFRGDAVILGGDVSDDLEVLETTLRLFARKFAHAFFVCGNHDLWTRSRGGEHRHADSMEKLDEVLRLCEACGVRTSPTLLNRDAGADGGAVWVAPVLGWYHESFDTEPDIPESVSTVRPPRAVMSDYKLCRWPEGLDPTDESVAAALDRVNDERLGWGDFLRALRGGDEVERRAPVLSFSHFLPRLELCPEKRYLFYPNLPKAVGSDYILRRIRGLAAEGGPTTASGSASGSGSLDGDGHGEFAAREHVHVFGHTHFGWDHTIDGIRYIQAPVSYPHEWKQRPGSLTVGPDSLGTEFDLSNGGLDAPLCVWAPDGEGRGGFVGEMRARWSDHYKENPREPENTELMWWVKGGRRSK